MTTTERALPAIDDERLLRRVLARALSTGGGLAELFWEQRMDAAVTVAGATDRSASSTLLQGAALRVLGDGTASHVVTDLVSPADLLDLAAAAADAFAA